MELLAEALGKGRMVAHWRRGLRSRSPFTPLIMVSVRARTQRCRCWRRTVLRSLADNVVTTSGKIELYKSKPEIVISSPAPDCQTVKRNFGTEQFQGTAVLEA